MVALVHQRALSSAGRIVEPLMGLLIARPEGGYAPVTALIDTGAQLSLLSPNLCQRLGLLALRTGAKVHITGATGEADDIPLLAEVGLRLQVPGGIVATCHEFGVMSVLHHDVVLGWDLLCKLCARISCQDPAIGPLLSIPCLHQELLGQDAGDRSSILPRGDSNAVTSLPEGFGEDSTSHPAHSATGKDVGPQPTLGISAPHGTGPEEGRQQGAAFPAQTELPSGSSAQAFHFAPQPSRNTQQTTAALAQTDHLIGESAQPAHFVFLMTKQLSSRIPEDARPGTFESSELLSSLAAELESCPQEEYWNRIAEPTDISEEEFARLVDLNVAAIESPEDKARARDLLYEFSDVFRTTISQRAAMECEPHRIETVHERPTGRRYPSRRTAAQDEFLIRELRKLYSVGVVVESRSGYNNPILLVPKPNGVPPNVWRMAHDHRPLNEVTIPLVAILPVLEDIFDDVGGSVWFSKADLTQGYFQLRLDPATAHKTAFESPLGHLEYTRAPLGLRNLPAAFNCALFEMLKDLRAFLKQYFDDLLAHSKSLAEHMEHVRRLLLCLRKNHIYLNLPKCGFFRRNLEHLGLQLGPDNSIRPTVAARTTIACMAPPHNAKQLLSQLGFFGFYRKFIKKFAELVEPMQEALRTTSPFLVWSPAAQGAFEVLRSLLSDVEGAVLKIPIRVGREGYGLFVVYFDMSNSTIAGNLAQRDQDTGEGEPVERPCYFYSRRLSQAEKNYSVTERELLAFVFTLEKARGLLQEAPVFAAVTDHAALVSGYLQQKSPSGRLARWLSVLQAFNFVLSHRAGKLHLNVDPLTRVEYVADESILGHVDPASLPSEGRRPLQGGPRGDTGLSVLAFTRSASRRSQPQAEPTPAQSHSPTRISSGPSGAGPLLAGDADPLRREPGAQDLESEEAQRDRLLRHRAARASPRTAHQPVTGERAAERSDVANSAGGTGPTRSSFRLKSYQFHEEIWLATGVLQMLKGGHREVAPESTTKRFAKLMADMAPQYRAIFVEEASFPIAIFTAPPHPWPNKEVPAPARRVEIVELAHQWGHFGVVKTLSVITDNAEFWWLGMKADVEVLVARCPACQRNNSHARLFHEALALPTPSAVFDRVHIDLLSMPASRPDVGGSFNYIFLCVDALSKYPVGVALRGKSATEVARALWGVMTTFGTPATITSDNGGEFVNQVVDALVNLHGVNRRLTSAYRPMANGQVERANRTILSVLRKLSGGAPEEWPSWLDFALLAMRTTVHKSIGASPFEVMFGRRFNPLADYHKLICTQPGTTTSVDPGPISEAVCGRASRPCRITALPNASG